MIISRNGFKSIITLSLCPSVALYNPEALSDVRNMCKILAPFFARQEVNGDNAIDFEGFKKHLEDTDG